MAMDNGSFKYIKEKGSNGAVSIIEGNGIQLPAPAPTNNSHLSITNADVLSKKLKNKSYNKSWKQAWFDFGQNTTIHGLRQAVEHQQFQFRRFLWLALVLAGFGLFFHQMITSIMYYYTWPVSVNIKIHYNRTLQFPAVTICNQNAFRKTYAAENGWHDLLSDMFSQTETSWTSDHSNTQHLNMSLYDIYNVTGHEKDDMIISCLFGRESCSHEDFTTVMTDYGKCFTFNLNKTNPRSVSKTGSDGGLQLLINVEQYEYMPGPNQGAGLSVLVHDQEEVPLVKDFGTAVPPVSHSLLGITLAQVSNLPKPYGQCVSSKKLRHYKTYSNLKCEQDEKQHFLQDQCGCLHIYMRESTVPQCTVQQYSDCVIPAFENYSLLQPDNDCPVPCTVYTYETFNSAGFISDFDAFRLLTSPLTDQLTPRYIRSQEVSQRVNEEKVTRFNTLVRDVRQAADDMSTALKSIFSHLETEIESLKAHFQELDARLNFHRKTGLGNVLNAMEDDFVRGWTILEEGTLPYLTFDFYELQGSFKRVIKKLEKSQNGTDLEQYAALSLWLVYENALLERLDVAERILNNVTEVHVAYKTGKPLINFNTSLNGRYDLSWITVELLQAVVNDGLYDQDQLYDTLQLSVIDVQKEIWNYIDMGWNFTRDFKINHTLWSETDSLFRSGSIGYNYYRSLYKTRIVDGPVNTIKVRIDEFKRLNHTFISVRQSLLDALSTKKNTITSIIQNSWHHIENTIIQAEMYITDTNQTQMELANGIKERNLSDVLEDIKLSMMDLRSNDKSIKEKRPLLQNAIVDIWSNLLSEYTTYKFYEMVQRDFNDSIMNCSFYLPYFADLLGVDHYSLMNISCSNLGYHLNADLHGMELDGKIKEVEGIFQAMQGLSDISTVLHTKDETFIVAFTQYMTTLSDFLHSTEIDTAFYKTNFVNLDVYMHELNYEEIVQNKAYDLTKLLGDIGGSMGLFLGASAITAVEILDVVMLQFIQAITHR